MTVTGSRAFNDGVGMGAWDALLSSSPCTWRGRLEAEHFDDFAVLLRLPDAPGARRFTVRQECEGKTAEWTPTLEVTRVP